MMIADPAPAASPPATAPPRLWPLIAFGAAALPLYGWAAWRGDLTAHPIEFAALFGGLCLLYAAACRHAARHNPVVAGQRRVTPFILVLFLFALGYRLIFVPATPALSDDFPPSHLHDIMHPN